MTRTWGFSSRSIVLIKSESAKEKRLLKLQAGVLKNNTLDPDLYIIRLYFALGKAMNG